MVTLSQYALLGFNAVFKVCHGEPNFYALTYVFGYSPQDLLHAGTKATDPRGPVILMNGRIMDGLVREQQEKYGLTYAQ